MTGFELRGPGGRTILRGGYKHPNRFVQAIRELICRRRGHRAGLSITLGAKGQESYTTHWCGRCGQKWEGPKA